MPKSSNWPEILRKSADRCAFHEICTKRTFQAVRSTFWPNPTFCPARCQNRQTGLKFCANRRIGALFMKFVQNARFRPCAARFGQIQLFAPPDAKIVPAIGGCQNRQTGTELFCQMQNRRPEILRKSADRCAFHEICTKRTFQAVRSTFWPNPSTKRTFQAVLPRFCRQMPKSSNWPEILRKSADRCAFHEICTKRTFQAVRSTFWPNPTFCPARCQNRQTGLKFCANRRIGALFMKFVQNARFRPCAARFGQIQLFAPPDAKIVKLA